jgi:hypothetical protein
MLDEELAEPAATLFDLPSCERREKPMMVQMCNCDLLRCEKIYVKISLLED